MQLSQSEILGVPNASMVPVMWIGSIPVPDDGSIKIEDLSPETSIIALQGPMAKQICESVLGENNHVGRFKWSSIQENSLGITG